MSSPQEFKDAQEGYFIKLEDEARIQRLVGYRLHQSLVSKPLSIEQFMPMQNEKQDNEKRVISKEQYERIKRIHKMK